MSSSSPQATSAAQRGTKTFPPDTDPGSIVMAAGPELGHGAPQGNPNNFDAAQLALTQQAFAAAMSTQVVSSQHPIQVGSPVTAELRQTTPIPAMGEGYREADEGGVH